MKLKLRLDKAAILEFLLQNVEKIVLGLVAIVFLLMVYSALTGVERYKKTPEQLIQAVRAGEDILAKTPPETGLTVADYVSQAKRSRMKIVEKPYDTTVAWDPMIFPKRPLRDSPALYAATDLRGAAEVGAFTMTVEADDDAAVVPGGAAVPAMARTGGTETRGQRWIVLTALVPIEKQELAFEDLKNAGPIGSYDPQRDMPAYRGYWVERVELTSPGDAVNPDWEKAETILSTTAVTGAMKQWGQSSNADVVASEYLDPNLTFPLGPRTDAPWGKSVAHPDEIPILETEGAGMGGMGMGPMGMPGMGMPGMGMPGAGMPSRAAPRGRTPRGAMPGMPGMPGGMGGAGAGLPAADDPFNLGGDGNAGENAGDNAALAGQALPPAHLLFRFFDFNVLPGKSYVYRVRLALINPNYQLKPAWLKDPKLAEQGILRTKWSEPSPVISVPYDSRVLAVSVKPARGYSEPSGKIIVTKWSQRKGIEAWEEFSVVRGQLANFPDRTFKPATGTIRPGGGMGMPPMGLGGLGNPTMGGGGGLDALMGGGGARATPGRNKRETPTRPTREAPGRPPREAPGMFGDGMPGPLAGPDMTGAFKVNYNSNAVVLDFRGGERLPGRRGNSLNLTCPGDILLLDVDGNLTVCNELNDKSARESLRSAETEQAEAQKAAEGAAPGGMGMPGMPPGMMGPGMMPPGGGLNALPKAGGATPRNRAAGAN